MDIQTIKKDVELFNPLTGGAAAGEVSAGFTVPWTEKWDSLHFVSAVINKVSPSHSGKKFVEIHSGLHLVHVFGTVTLSPADLEPGDKVVVSLSILGVGRL